jgi:hypothetical protein
MWGFSPKPPKPPRKRRKRKPTVPIIPTLNQLPASGRTEEGYDESVQGAVEISPLAHTLREKVFAFIAQNNGVTDREIQKALGLHGNTQRPRRWELWQAGRIRIVRNSDGQPRYHREGVRVKSILWVVGQEDRCALCGQVYTKTFSSQPVTTSITKS